MWRFSVLLSLVVCIDGAQPGIADKRKPSPDFGKATQILRTSFDPAELSMAASFICQFENDSRQALETLLELLEDPAFWRKLDVHEAYKLRDSDLRMRPVLIAMGRIGTPEAEAALFKLADNKKFMAEAGREDILIEALGWIREPSLRLLMYLEAQAQPGDHRRPKLAVSGLVRIASPETCAIVEKCIRSPNFETPDKLDWLTTNLLLGRNNPNVVNLYKRLITSDVKDAKLRNMIVQTLFDFRPDEWYLSARRPFAPARAQASLAVLKELLLSADLALKLDISNETREGVLKAKKEIQRLLYDSDTPKKEGTRGAAEPAEQYEETASQHPLGGGTDRKLIWFWMAAGLLAVGGIALFWRRSSGISTSPVVPGSHAHEQGTEV